MEPGQLIRGVRQIADGCGLPRSTTHKAIQRLKDRGTIRGRTWDAKERS